MTPRPSPAEIPDLVQLVSRAAQHVAGAREPTEAETVSAIVSAAVGTVPGAEHAGVSLLSGNGSITSQEANLKLVTVARWLTNGSIEPAEHG